MTTTGTEPDLHDGDVDLAMPRPGRRLRTGPAVCALLVAGLLGAAADRYAQHTNRPDDCSPEAGFARDMSGHDALAVEMAMLAW